MKEWFSEKKISSITKYLSKTERKGGENDTLTIKTCGKCRMGFLYERVWN